MITAQINGRSISIADRRYDSDAFAVLLDYLRLPSLAIDGNPVNSSGDIAGFGGSANLFSQTVSVQIGITPKENGGCDFVFLATLPQLPDGILAPSIFVEPLKRLANITFSFASEDELVYLVSMESDENHDGLFGVPLKGLGFEYLQDAATRAPLSLDVHAEIDIGSTPIQIAINVPLGAPSGPKVLTVTSPSMVPLENGLAEIVQFIEKVVGIPAASRTFPESLESISTFFLDEFTLLLDPDSLHIDFLTFRLISAQPLVLIANHLSIENTGVRLNITPGRENNPTLTAITIFGSIDIDDETKIEIDVSVPSDFRTGTWTFCASGDAKLDQIGAVEKLPIAITPGELQLHEGFLKLEELSLKLFEIDFKLSPPSVTAIRFDVAVLATCQITHGFDVSNPRLAFTAANPFDKQSRELTGQIDTTITLGDINFGIEARKCKDGWDFVGEAEPGGIHLSRLVRALETKYSRSLPQIIQDDVVVQTLRLEFSTKTTDGSKSSKVLFTLEIDFPITSEPNSQQGRLRFDAHFTDEPQKKEYRHEFSGELTLGPVGFGTKYSEDAKASFFVAAYSDSKNQNIKLKQLVEHVSSTLANLIPEGLGIVVKDAVFAFDKTGEDSRKFLFGTDLAIQCDFSRLPLVGKYFSGPGAAKIGVDNLKIVFASKPFVATEVQNLNQLLSAFDPPVSKLPDVTRTNTPDSGNATQPGATMPVLKQGANIAAVLNLGGSSKPLSFPASPGAQQSSSDGQAIPNTTTGDSAIWLNIQKSIGPVHFERVGVEYRQSKLWVLLSASLTAAGLTISLDGLSLGTPLDVFDLKPALRGLGIDYRNDFVEIGGSFSAVPAQDPNSEPEYSGAVTLKARGLTISAVGKYTTIDQHPSLFIFGLLDYPIGGPPFFFVTGLAAGFGYQRALVIPTIDRLGQFSLITAAQKNSSFTDVLRNPNLAKEIPPAAGEHFLAAGVLFTSFKLVESTVLLFAAFGKRFELHLLGLSKMRMPAALKDDASTVEPVAEVELAVKGSFIPDDGFLELRAQLTPTSYLFSKNCHLTGGFAFLCWFKPKPGVASTGPEGDFVLTLGGYHPAFHVPSNYPAVPRLGFNWQVTPETLSLRGEVYFALTPAAVMAGGYLEAEWRSGKVYAWFKAGVDFLIAWKPYHYDARAYIDIGVEVTFEFFGTHRLTLDVGADLHIWGPDFAGEATIHLWIISFTIHFGNQDSSKQPAIEWAEFQSSFLLKKEPKPKELKPEVCSVVVSDGLVQKGNGNDLGVINGKHFCLRTDSRIPATAAERNGTTLKLDDKLAAPFGVAPVGIGSVKSSTHSITLMRDNRPTGDEFEYTALARNFPAALWGKSATPTINGSQFVNGLSGFEIRPRNLRTSDATANIKREELVIHDPRPQQCRWERGAKAFNPVKKTEQQFKDDLKAINNTTRRALLASLGVDFIDLDDSLTYQYLKQPQSEAA